jgi:DHA2 family lincomycin resistance protein-like MFS transporter
MHLYPHGSSILGTLQQVAAAFGTALSVTVMTLQDERGGASLGPVEAQLEGMQAAFAVSAAISLLVVVMAWLLPGRPDEVSPDAVEPAPADELEDCEHRLEPADCTC